MRRSVTTAYIGAQGSYKVFTDYLKSINLDKNAPEYAQQAEEFLSAFKSGFRGVD